MKKNNKGFLLVETLVVATFCITVFVILFLQFKNLINNYNDSFNYNTVEGIYNLNTIKKYLNENKTKDLILTKEKPYILINKNDKCEIENYNNLDFCSELIAAGNFKTIIYTNSDLTDLKEHLRKNKDINQGLKDFINKIQNKKNKHRLISEYNNGTYATITYN